jgi:hypothetical protein
LASAVAAMLVGALTLEEATTRVEWVARILIDEHNTVPSH